MIYSALTAPKLDPRDTKLPSVKNNKSRNIPRAIDARFNTGDNSKSKKKNAFGTSHLDKMIDNWPAQSLGRSFASTQIVVHDGRLAVLSEAETSKGPTFS